MIVYWHKMPFKIEKPVPHPIALLVEFKQFNSVNTNSIKIQIWVSSQHKSKTDKGIKLLQNIKTSLWNWEPIKINQTLF